MVPLAVTIRTARHVYATAAIAKELLLLATILVCTLINEGSYVLDTQLETYHGPVEALTPPG